MTTMWRGLLVLVVSCALASCGGGGGGSDAPVTLSPSSLSANVEVGNSATLTVRARAKDPSQFARGLYVYIVDSEQVLTGTVNLSNVDANTLAATIYTSPGLRTGHHRGTLQIQLCADSACSTQYAGSPLSLPYDFNVTPGPLRATATGSTSVSVHEGGSLVTPLGVEVSGPDADWTVDSSADWLQPAPTRGHGDGSFELNYDTASLTVGSYEATVTVRAADGQTATLDVALEVLPTQFVLDGAVPSFSAVNGAPIAAQPLGFALNNEVPSAWSALSSQPWLTITPASGTTPATPSLQPDPGVGPLASGTHNANITLSSPGIADRTLATRLTLLAPTLSANASSFTLGGAKGRSLGATTLPIALNTGGNSHPWALGPLPAWLTSSTASGQVGAAGSTLRFTPQTAAASAGSVSATVNVTATVNGDTVTLPITANLNLDQRRLLPSTWAVGLASTPLGTVLSRTLSVADNFGGTLAWTATSDSAWLAVTASGSTGSTSSLTLTADPASLPDATISLAKVTIASSTPGVESAVLRVALWKNSAAPGGVSTLPLTYSEIVADRLRPLVYAHAGGSSIDIYNAYTSTLVGSIPSVGAALGGMTVSPDGSRLYAVDTANARLAVVDLDARAKLTDWTLDLAADGSTSVLAIRPNGVEVVLAGHGRAYSTGRSLGSTGIRGSLAATDDGRQVYTQDSGFSPASVAAYDLDYSAISGGVLMVTQRAGDSFINGASNGRDIAVRGDGSAVYTASGAPYRCSRVAPQDLAFVGSLPGGDAYPNNVEVSSDGRVICGIDGTSTDFWVHAADGTLLGSHTLDGALVPGQMVVTPDGMLVVVLTTAPVIGFVPIGAP
ncbi:hypothetical protein [Variovorax sp. YR752]|uniref:BACON domain-containing protein n=1 Tax=Variovorax sp. YR752 TaxID=1884383 RepID=UPI00313794A1